MAPQPGMWRSNFGVERIAVSAIDRAAAFVSSDTCLGNSVKQTLSHGSCLARFIRVSHALACAENIICGLLFHPDYLIIRAKLRRSLSNLIILGTP